MPDWETWYGNFMAEQESRTQGFKDDKRGKQREYFLWQKMEL